MRIVKRVALVIACMASLVMFVFPAQPAAAAPYCAAEPHVPGMIDYKLQQIDGPTRAVCEATMAVIRAESKLEQWFTRTRTWEQVAYGDGSEKNASWVWADAYVSCAGMGSVSYRTVGYATGVHWNSWNAQDGWRAGSYRTFQCSYELQVIHP